MTGAVPISVGQLLLYFGYRGLTRPNVVQRQEYEQLEESLAEESSAKSGFGRYGSART